MNEVDQKAMEQTVEEIAYKQFQVMDLNKNGFIESN